MKKSLIAGASVFALVSGFGTSAWADDINVAVGHNVLSSTVSNNGQVLSSQESEGIGGGADNSLNNNFKANTYQGQVLNQNNIDSGINSAQQGGNAAGIAVDADGVTYMDLPPDLDANLAAAGNWAYQKVTNNAQVNADDDDPIDDEDEFNGIAGDAEDSMRNNFENNTFQNQAINQNNINSGINSAQQGTNAAALAIDLDGAEDGDESVNAAFAGNHLWQDVDNTASNSDDGNDNNQDNDAVAGEPDNSLVNDFGNNSFNNQVINQNNINAGINSAQQGSNSTAIAASLGSEEINVQPGQADVSDTGTTADQAIGAVQNALGYEFFVDDSSQTYNVEGLEGNVAVAKSKGVQFVDNDATNSGEAGSEQDGGIGGDPENSLYNDFGTNTFQQQVINQNNINAGINSSQQGSNTAALAVDTDGSLNFADINVAAAHSKQLQHSENNAFTEDLHNDGVGGFDEDDGPEEHALHNFFGNQTFEDQVVNQNNINAGINSAQQGMNTTALAYDNSASLVDVNVAWAHTEGKQLGRNDAKDGSFAAQEDITGLGIGGNPRDHNLNNEFGNNTFRDQVLNQNNVNAGINSAQQGGNTSALAIADNLSLLDVNLAVSKTELTQGTFGNGDWDNEATVTSLVPSGGIGGNAVGQADGKGPLSNHFGNNTYQNQVMNQNNINSGINSAQQGANTTALAIDLGGPGGVDLNGAVSLSSLSQTVSNSAVAMGAGNGGVGGGATYALNNNFGNNTFQNQVMNQNNINSGINSVQQGANTVSMAVSGGTLPFN